MDYTLRKKLSDFIDAIDPYGFMEAMYDGIVMFDFWNDLQGIITYLEEIVEEESEFSEEARELIKEVKEIM